MTFTLSSAKIICTLYTYNTFNRKRRSGKKDFAVSANMAYQGHVNLYCLRDASGASGESEASGDCGCVSHDDRIYEISSPHGPIS